MFQRATCNPRLLCYGRVMNLIGAIIADIVYTCCSAGYLRVLN